MTKDWMTKGRSSKNSVWATLMLGCQYIYIYACWTVYKSAQRSAVRPATSCRSALSRHRIPIRWNPGSSLCHVLQWRPPTCCSEPRRAPIGLVVTLKEVPTGCCSKLGAVCLRLVPYLSTIRQNLAMCSRDDMSAFWEVIKRSRGWDDVCFDLTTFSL